MPLAVLRSVTETMPITAECTQPVLRMLRRRLGISEIDASRLALEFDADLRSMYRRLYA